MYTTNWYDEPSSLASRCSNTSQPSWRRSRTKVLVVDTSVIAPAVADGERAHRSGQRTGPCGETDG